MSTTRDQVVEIKNFGGINRRDGADVVANNEFLTLQNCYHATRGLIYRTQGSTYLIEPGDIKYCDKILGLSRYYNAFGERETLYWCKPDETLFTAPSVPDFAITNGAASSGYLPATSTRIWASYVGKGLETDATYITDVTPAALGSITIVSSNTPDWVETINYYFSIPGGDGIKRFVAAVRGNVSKKIECGWVNNGDTSHPYYVTQGDWRQYAGGLFYKVTPGGGTLKRGTYFIASAWMEVADNGTQACYPTYQQNINNGYITVTVDEDNSSIEVACGNSAGKSVNNAYGMLYFVGTKTPTQHPMVCFAAQKADNSLGSAIPAILTAMPTGTNAQTAPVNTDEVTGSAGKFPVFWPELGSNSIGPASQTERPDFLVKRSDAGVISEVMYSGSYYLNFLVNPFTANTVSINTASKRAFWLKNASRLSFCDFLGLKYIGNGANLLLQTDGYSVTELTEKLGTIQPGYPIRVLTFKNQLCCTASDSEAVNTPTNPSIRSQVFASNAMQPDNWADGGSGTLLRFITIGDAFSDGVLAMGIFSFNSAVDGPNTFLISLKASSCWASQNIPDATSGVPAAQNMLSGRTGCQAPDTVAATANGLAFLGSDGVVYLVRSTGGEPVPLGRKSGPLLAHLVGNPALMAKCCAVFHWGFYKLSYPSAADSTENDAQLWCDMRLDDQSQILWSGPHTGINLAAQAVQGVDGDNFDRIGVVAGENAVALLDDPSTFEHLGVEQDAVVEWKTSRLGNPTNLKRFTSMMIDAYYDTQFAHDLRLEAFAGDQYSQKNKVLSAGTAIWDSSNFDSSNWGSADYVPVNFFFEPANLVGRTIRWKLTHTGNAQLILASAVLFYQPERRRISE